jgi:hypothetical protein
LAKLLPLIPPPRANLIRFHGAWAPHAAIREQAIPPTANGNGHQHQHRLPLTVGKRKKEDATETDNRCGDKYQSRAEKRVSWIPWSDLAAKTFALDFEACPRCGHTPMRVIAVVANPTMEQLEALRDPEHAAFLARRRRPRAMANFVLGSSSLAAPGNATGARCGHYRTYAHVPHMDHHTARRSWFVGDDPGPAFHLLARVMELLGDESWHDALHLALGWYTKSNTKAPGVDGSIILAQVGLEHLAWEWLVNQESMLGPEGWEALPAAERMRLLVARLGGPEIPAALAKLVALAKAHNWATGPNAIAGYRNAVVHPTGKNRAKVLGPFREASSEVPDLCLWYLELAFLRILGFNGQYLNRCANGGVALVPWASPVPVVAAK